jgi:hypothetical protein
MVVSLVLLALLLAAFLWGVYRLTRSSRWVLVVGYSVGFFLIAQIGWMTLLMLNIVPVDRIFRSFGRYDALQWFRPIAHIPPLLAALALAVVLWRRSSPKSR